MASLAPVIVGIVVAYVLMVYPYHCLSMVFSAFNGLFGIVVAFVLMVCHFLSMVFSAFNGLLGIVVAFVLMVLKDVKVGDGDQSNKLTVSGKVDPTMLDKDGGGSDKKAGDKSEKSKEPPETTAVMKLIHCQCQGCFSRVEEIVKKTNGYQKMTVDKEKGLVSVTGTMDMKALAEELNKNMKRVEILPPKKEGGEKKDKGGGGAGGGVEKKEKGGGGGEKKGKGGGGGEKKEKGGGGELRRREKAKFVGITSQHLKEEPVAIRERRYTFSEVEDIIDNFKNCIGEGGFGKVYKGKLESGKAVAVKINSAASRQGLRELQAEVEVLMRIHHRNLVHLYGYSDEGPQKTLIYEYVENGNLQKHLSETNSSVLSWRRRLQIALDAARGLNYLHNDCTPPIIHRDLKPTNILLDENWRAKIADFGLSRVFATEKDTHVSTRIAGTFGYFDPELFRVPSNAFRKTSDVYSFGIILLELITGKTAVMNNPSVHDDVGKINIRDWVEPKIAGGDARSCADPRLAGNFNPNSVTKVAKLAKACTGPAQDRPDMREVERRLVDCLASEPR